MLQFRVLEIMFLPNNFINTLCFMFLLYFGVCIIVQALFFTTSLAFSPVNLFFSRNF